MAAEVGLMALPIGGNCYSLLTNIIRILGLFYNIKTGYPLLLSKIKVIKIIKKRRKEETMLKIVMIMLCGIGTGYLLRNKKMSFIGRVITALIWVLLFLLGIEVGANPRIINGLQTLGLEAIVLTIAGSLGSTIFAWALWRYVCRKEAGNER